MDVNSINIHRDVNVVNMSVEQRPPRSTAARRDGYHHGDLKRALTSAALSLVAEKGPKGFTLTEAARRAGVSAAAPYRHFADKAELLATVAEQGFRALHTDLTAVADVASEPKDRVIELGRVYIRWAVTHPDHYRVMFGAEIVKGGYPTLVVAAEQAFGDLLGAITRCQEAGMFQGQDPREIAARVWSLVHGVASLAIGGELHAVGVHQDPEAMASRIVAELLGDR
jgi:AcrR family transcriptional regulator